MFHDLFVHIFLIDRISYIIVLLYFISYMIIFISDYLSIFLHVGKQLDTSEIE